MATESPSASSLLFADVSKCHAGAEFSTIPRSQTSYTVFYPLQHTEEKPRDSARAGEAATRTALGEM